MNRMKEILIKVLDEGETTSVRDMKWPSFKVGKWLFFSTAFISTLLGCILGSAFMNVDSREYAMLCMPLLMNAGIFLSWLLYHLWGMLQISRKQKVCIIVFPIVYVVGALMLWEMN